MQKTRIIVGELSDNTRRDFEVEMSRPVRKTSCHDGIATSRLRALTATSISVKIVDMDGHPSSIVFVSQRQPP